MKILLIDVFNMPYYNDRSTGGIETVVKVQLEILAKNGNEVLFLTSDDSDKCNISGVIQHSTGFKSKFFDDSGVSPIKRNQKINEKIALLANKVDVVLNHCQANNSIVKCLSGLSVPSVTYSHSAVEVIGGIIGLGYVKTLSEYDLAGGLVVTPSQTSMEDWQKYSDKVKGVTNNPFKNYHYMYAVEKTFDVCIDRKNHGIMPARMNESKNIHYVVKVHESIGREMVICHTTPRDSKEVEYKKLVDAEVGPNTKLYENLNRKDIDSLIDKSQYMVTAGPETFSIAVSESLVRGTPIILVSSKDNHSTMEFKKVLGLDYCVTKTTKKTFAETLLNFVPLSTEQRIELSEKTLDFFSHVNAYKRTMEVIEKAIQHKKSKETGLLDFLV